VVDKIERFIEELRARWREPRSLTYVEFRKLRLKCGVSLADCSDLLSIGTDAIFNAENQMSYVDGGIASVLDQMFGDLLPPTPTPAPEPEPAPFPVAEAKPAPEPPPPPSLDERLIAEVRKLDLGSQRLRSHSQKGLAVVDIFVALTGQKKFSTKHRAPGSQFKKALRAQVCEIIGISDRNLQDAWLFYRHVQCGTISKMAMRFVRNGQLKASSALLDWTKDGYDPPPERGYSRRDRERIKKEKAAGKSEKPDERDGKKRTTRRKKRSNGEKSARSSGSQRTLRVTKKSCRAARTAETTVGAMLLQLRAVIAENPTDRELLEAVEGITSAVAPLHHELKQLVLRRTGPVKKQRKKPTKTTKEPKESDHE
jgi:hypothetical protein